MQLVGALRRFLCGYSSLFSQLGGPSKLIRLTIANLSSKGRFGKSQSQNRSANGVREYSPTSQEDRASQTG